MVLFSWQSYLAINIVRLPCVIILCNLGFRMDVRVVHCWNTILSQRIHKSSNDTPAVITKTALKAKIKFVFAINTVRSLFTRYHYFDRLHTTSLFLAYFLGPLLCKVSRMHYSNYSALKCLSNCRERIKLQTQLPIPVLHQ